MSRLFLGVDGGATRTVAVISDEEGLILGAARAGGCNVQVVGASAAGGELRAAVDGALRMCSAGLKDVAAAAFGVVGRDRAPDRTAIQGMVDQYAPVGLRFVENDALLVLRAATKDAVGVGLVAGAGTNCVGRDRYGRRHQVGGMGSLSGDVGYAEDLAMRAIGGAWRAHDGRTGPSQLSESIPRALCVSTVEDIPKVVVRGIFPTEVVGRAVECLFEEARKGDGLALRIIEDTGSRMGAAAAAVMRALVLRGTNAIVVMGGAMLQRPEHRLLVDAADRRIRDTVNEAHVIVLEIEPVIGAVLFAKDLQGHASVAYAKTLRSQSHRIDELCGSA